MEVRSDYSDEPYEVKANCHLVRAEPVECVPGPSEKLPSYVCNDGNDIVSVLPGASSSPDLSPTVGQDPMTTFRATAVSASMTANGAGTATPPVTDVTPVAETAPTANDQHSHIQCLLDGLPVDLTAEQRARTMAFVKSRSNVLSRSEYDIGRTRIILHCIDTGDNTPHFEQLRHHPTTQLPMIDEHVEHMLVHNVIEPEASPWCSNVIMVRKQNRSMRFCVDYRKVNELIKKDKFPLPALTP